MTALVCWVGVDSRGPASIYLASDSRISWSNGKTWDRARKVFTCRNSPDLLGYLGQAFFPSHVLSQVCNLIDLETLFGPEVSSAQKREVIFHTIKQQFQSYPVEHDRAFTVVYCTREGIGMASQFDVSALSWDASSGWKQEFFPMPSTSGIIKAWGSGQGAVDKWYKRWLRTRQGRRTSRSVFSAFCDALADGEDSFTGGAPQLVGLYRQGTGETFGIIFAGTRYILGIPSQDLPLRKSIEWRNALFERCDGHTMKRLDEAQRHSRPQGLGKSL